MNGKLDLGALPAPGPAAGDAVPSEAPRTPDEQALARIWADVLGVAEIGRHDDFFALGGHSLLATRVLARVGDTLGRELPLWAVFEAPTLARLAARLADAPPPESGAIPRVPRDEQLPLSFVQEQVWFLEHFEPGSTNYNVPRALRMHGVLDPEAVSQVFADLEARHEILRTSFPDVDGVPVQEIHDGHGIPVSLVDRSDLPAAERAEFAYELVVSLGRQPFDLANGPLLRVTLLRLAPDEHILIIIEHHLLHDGWAQGVFLRDFLELYEARTTGLPARLPELPVQYADFAVWQRRSLRGERLRDLLDYWLTKLADPPTMLRLPTDRPRPEDLTSRGDQETVPLDPDLARLLGGFGRDHAASLFMTMFAAFSALMYGYSGQQDVLIGTGVANRQRPELENLLGMMINSVVLRADLSGDPSFLTLLDRTRQTCLAAFAHQDMPVGKLVERLRPVRDLSHMPLFQVMFSFLDTPMPNLRVPGLRFEVLEAHNRSAKFDLNVVVIVPEAFRGQGAEVESPGISAEQVTVLAEYNADLFDASTIREMFDRYRQLLHAVVTEPGRSIDEHLRELGLAPAPLIGP